MLTQETAVTGTEVIYKDPATGTMQTTVVEGSYIDEKLGLMVKSALFPGGMPADRYSPIFEQPTVIEEALPAVSFEVVVLDEKDPVKITPQLIREKSKPLTDLVIANYLDDKGYEAVKKALASKAVKTRTAIEKKAKEVLKDIKTKHAAEIKEITDYVESLYVVCREVEKNLQDKLSAIDTIKAAKAKELADAELAKTTGRDNKMYELGLTFNGTAFVGYGRQYTKNSLYSLDQVSYDALVTELEGLQLEYSVTGVEKPVPVVTQPIAAYQQSNPTSIGRIEPAKGPGDFVPRLYPTAVYDKTLPDGTRIVLTRGEISDPEPGAKVINDRVQQSGVYIQII